MFFLVSLDIGLEAGNLVSSKAGMLAFLTESPHNGFLVPKLLLYGRCSGLLGPRTRTWEVQKPTKEQSKRRRQKIPLNFLIW